MTASQVTEFLGWASILNIGYLLIVTFFLTVMRETVSSIHSRVLDIDKKELGARYFSFLSTYKVMTLVFSVVPYISLKIMGY